MKEELNKELQQKTVKVHNILRLSPHNRELYQRPIDVKIDQIRKKLQAMVKGKIKRSGSEQNGDRKSRQLSQMNRNITQLYSILCPKTIKNTLPVIKQQQKKIPKNSENKIQAHTDSFISKVKTEVNEELDGEKDNLYEQNRLQQSKPAQYTSEGNHKNLLFIVEKIKSNKNSVFEKNRSKEKLKIITTRKTEEFKKIFQLEQEKEKQQILHENLKKKNRKILSQPNIKTKITTAKDNQKKNEPTNKMFKKDSKKQMRLQPNPKIKKNSLKIVKITNSHRDFTNFINCCNSFYAERSGPFTYFLGKGNNPQVIRRALRKRGWVEVNQIEQANLVWTQKKSNTCLQSMKILNVVEEEAKKLKFRSTFYFQNKSGEKGETEENLGFKKLICPDSNMWQLEEKVFTEQNFKRSNKQKVSFIPKVIFTCKENDPILMHNHFTNHHQIAYKQALFWNLKQYYEKKGINPFDHIPLTFHIKDLNDSQWNRFRQKYSEMQSEETLWIVKPAQNTNRGTGIYVKDSIEQVRSLIQEKKMERPESGFIIQKYLIPMLYNKRKFDIRCYLLVTVVNGFLRAYWYEEGYCRTSCKFFNAKNLKNKYIHLTNDAIQKNCSQYGKFEPGNKLSFDDMAKYIEKTQSTFTFESQIYPKMVDLARDTIAATASKIHKADQNFCFEIFGLDYMIDQNGKVWLIEVNRNPCLETSTSLLCRLISSMIDDAFRIAIDPLFPVADPNKCCKNTDADAFQSNSFQFLYETPLVQEQKSA